MMKFSGILLVAGLAAGISACNTGSENNTLKDSSAIVDSANTVRLELVSRDLHFPVEVKPAPDSTHRLFIAELGGKILILKNGQVSPVPFLDISNKMENKDSAPNVRSMYAIAFSPQFTTNRKLYVVYNAPTKIDTNVCKLVVSEFTASSANPDIAEVSTERRVFELEGHTVQFDAGEIMFGPDGDLYISIGDNNTPMKDRMGENLNSYLGKLLRINVSSLPYTVPADNPFIAQKNAKPEIWAYGLRRLWRYYFDDETHTFIGGDIGDKLEEEVDTLTKGGNYGWPLVEGDSVRVKNDPVDLSTFIRPVFTYGRKDGICVIGGRIYHGKNIPAIAGRYVFTDYTGIIYTLTKTTQGNWQRQKLTILDKQKDPFIINGFDEDEKHEIYLSGVLNTDNGSKGALYKLVKGY